MISKIHVRLLYFVITSGMVALILYYVRSISWMHACIDGGSREGAQKQIKLRSLMHGILFFLTHKSHRCNVMDRTSPACSSTSPAANAWIRPVSAVGRVITTSLSAHVIGF
jgi:hypothetical protein